MKSLESLKVQHQKLGEEIEQLESAEKYEKGDWIKVRRCGWRLVDGRPAGVGSVAYVDAGEATEFEAEIRDIECHRKGREPRRGDLIWTGSARTIEFWRSNHDKLIRPDYRIILPKEEIESIRDLVVSI